MSTQKELTSTPVSRGPQVATMKGQGQTNFHGRLNEAAGDVSFRKLGRLTDTHPETVRRYMQGQAPSATFLTNLCKVLGISGEWLLTGRGPMKCTDMRSHALNQADPSELMTAVANTLTDLCDRVERLEKYVQTLETRVRGGGRTEKNLTDSGLAPKPKATKLNTNSGTLSLAQSDEQSSEGEHDRTVQSIESKPKERAAVVSGAAGNGKAASAEDGSSAQRIRNAIAKRSS